MAWTSLKDFHRFYYDDENKFYEALFQCGIMNKAVICPNCYATVENNTKVLEFRCSTLFKKDPNREAEPCQFKQSAREGTIFSKSDLHPKRIMELVTVWLQIPQNLEDLGLESTIISEYSGYCRAICIDWLLKQTDKLGGIVDGIPKIVEIAEAYFNDQKSDELRVFGGIDRDSKQCFFVHLPNLDSTSILNVIRARIEPGTIIVSRSRKAYDCLSHEGFQHLTLNRSMPFVNPNDPRVHTQNIVRLWREVRGLFERFEGIKEHFEGRHAEFQFKRAHKSNLIETFLKLIALSYPPE